MVKTKTNKHKRYIISAQNQKIIDEFIEDFKIGRNVSVSKGGRKETTLLKNNNRMKTICAFVEKKYKINDITKIKEKQILTIFDQMDKGIIKTLKNKPFNSVDSYMATFKAFWRWLIKSNKKNNRIIEDITTDFIVQKKRPEFTHFTKEQLEEMSKTAPNHHRTLMWFLFDSGARPQEIKKLMVGDITKDKNGVVWLNIKNQIAKKGSFGRKIKLLLCNNLILDWIKNKKQDDLLFDYNPHVFNKFLKRNGEKIIGRKITSYDFRHNACCYWLNIYKKDSALKYRFGWKKSEMIEYYSRYIGLKDDISEEDLFTNEIKSKIERDLAKLKTTTTIKEEQHNAEISEMREMLKNLIVENKKIKTEMKRQLKEIVKAKR